MCITIACFPGFDVVFLVKPFVYNQKVKKKI